MNIQLPTVTTYINLPTTFFGSAASIEKKVPILSFSIKLRSQKEIFRCLDNKKDEMLPAKLSNALVLERSCIFTIKFLSRKNSTTAKARKDKFQKSYQNHAKPLQPRWSHIVNFPLTRYPTHHGYGLPG